MSRNILIMLRMLQKPAGTRDSVNNFEGMGAVYKKADPGKLSNQLG